jgi:hypothetical protein
MGAPERLAGAARAEQEKVILSGRQKSRDKCHNETQNGIRVAILKDRFSASVVPRVAAAIQGVDLEQGERGQFANINRRSPRRGEGKCSLTAERCRSLVRYKHFSLPTK